MKPEFDKVLELTKDIKMAMLTTQNIDGALHSRPMQSQQMDQEGNFWFFTSDDTGKVEDIEEFPQVNLAFANPDDGSYVSIAGPAELNKDRAKIKELWNPSLKAWFPDGPEQEDIALLKIKMESAEYWDAPQGKVVKLFGIAKAAISGQEYKEKGDEHGRANFNRH